MTKPPPTLYGPASPLQPKTATARPGPVSPPPTRYGIALPLQAKAAGARPDMISPPPTRYGIAMPMQAKPLHPGRLTPPKPTAPPQPPYATVVQPMRPALTLSDTYVKRITGEAIKAALADINKDDTVVTSQDAIKYKNENGIVFNTTSRYIIWQNPTTNTVKVWRNENRLKRKAQAQAEAAIDAAMTALAVSFSFDGGVYTKKERLVAKIQGKGGGDGINIKDAVGKIESNSGINTNRGLTFSKPEPTTKEKQQLTTLKAGSHVSSGIGPSGCSIFFTRTTTTATIIALGHHVHSSSSYDIIWSSIGLTGRLDF